MSTEYVPKLIYGVAFPNETSLLTFARAHEIDKVVDGFDDCTYNKFNLCRTYCQLDDMWYFGFVLLPGLDVKRVQEEWNTVFKGQCHVSPEAIMFVDSY